jgi:hypothetical protein
MSGRRSREQSPKRNGRGRAAAGSGDTPGRQERSRAPAKESDEPRWLGLSRSVVALASALIALIVSIPTGIYTLWPALSPDPKTKVGATLETLTFDRNVTYRQYVGRFPRHRVDGATPDENGNVFYIRATIEGFKREQLRVRWFTYEATNQTRLDRLGSTAPLEEVFKPQAPVNTQIAQVWVPAPPQSGEYFVRFELYSSGNVLLSFIDSKPFHVEEV